MDPPQSFPFTDEEMNEAGLLGEEAIATMKAYPELLKLSPFALQCIDHAFQSMGPTSSVPLASAIMSEGSYPSALALTSQDSAGTDVSAYVVSDYERITHYNGVTDVDDHPHLLYRSDMFTNPFHKPRGRFSYPPSKSIRGVYNTSLNKVWDTVGPQVRDLVKGRKVRYSSIDPARFLTYGEYTKTLGPVVIWVGVYPGSTSPDTAHEVSQDILMLLVKNGVEGAVVEWREAVPSKLAGPALIRVMESSDPTAHVRRIFTPALNVPLATKERESEDAQGSLTLYFHEGKDKHGNVSDKVLGVSNCHVLRKDTTVDYEFKGSGAPKKYVRVNGLRRFQQGLDEIRSLIGDHAIVANFSAGVIVELEAKESLDREDARELHKARKELLERLEAIHKLEEFYNEVKNNWCDIGLRNIGHVRYAKAVSVDVEGGTRYTEDWAVFEVDEVKVKPEFEGTFVDLGTAIALPKVAAMFYPYSQSSDRTPFKYPVDRKLEIHGVVTPELLANPDWLDDEGQPCLIVGKDGTKTGLTFGCYAGLVSFLCNEAGIESVELGIYNWGKNTRPFSDKGDSGALVWDGLGCIFGQLHSGQSKGGLTSFHIGYVTPGWWLLQCIRVKFPHAEFYQKTYT